MSTTQLDQPRHTIAEYLELEEKAADKHEFHEGEILALSAGSFEHSAIKTNLIASLHRRLQRKPFRRWTATCGFASTGCGTTSTPTRRPRASRCFLGRKTEAAVHSLRGS